MSHYGLSLPEGRARSWVRVPVDASCKLNRATYPHAIVAHEGINFVWTTNGCICNDFIAIRYRHQVATPRVNFDVGAVAETMGRLALGLHLNRVVSLSPWKRWKVVRSYAGPWRLKYLTALKHYEDFGLVHRDRLVSMFGKDDLYMCAPEKAPRAIQFRRPVFALEQARFTKAVEEWFYHMRDEYDTFIVAKSDPFTVASHLLKKTACFANPAFLMLDASKFDSCVDVVWLKIVMQFYLKLFHPRHHPRIRWLWQRTFVNYGSSRSGLRYRTWGTRMSGDMDTSLGNCLIMWTMLKVFCERAGVRHSIMVNGDDSLVVVERSALPKLRDLSIFKDFGFNMKFEVAFDVEQAEFCQSRLVHTKYGPTMARNPERVLGRSTWSTSKLAGSRKRGHLLTLGHCERAASWGVPIASVLATKMIQAAGNAKPRFINPWLFERYQQMRWWRAGQEPIIDLETRLSYEQAWGVSPERQLHIERSIVVRPTLRPSEKQRGQYRLLLGLD